MNDGEREPGGDAARVDPRVVRSRRAILGAATTLFLRDGYVMTTMDAIAAEAGVSKRTVYNNFVDKEALFREVVLGASRLAEGFAEDAAALLDDPGDLGSALIEVARRLAAIVTSPDVVRVRRLIIGEATRVPELSVGYYRSAPGTVLATLAASFGELSAAGRLQVDDPNLAADQFAYLVVGSLLDRALFDGHDTPPDPHVVTATAVAGAETFLARYRAGR